MVLAALRIRCNGDRFSMIRGKKMINSSKVLNDLNKQKKRLNFLE